MDKTVIPISLACLSLKYTSHFGISFSFYKCPVLSHNYGGIQKGGENTGIQQSMLSDHDEIKLEENERKTIEIPLNHSINNS